MHYVSRPTYSNVITSAYGTSAILPPNIYDAEPGFFVQLLPLGSGKFMPGLFGRPQPEYFEPWLNPNYGNRGTYQPNDPYQPNASYEPKRPYSKRSAAAEPEAEPQYYVR